MTTAFLSRKTHDEITVGIKTANKEDQIRSWIFLEQIRDVGLPTDQIVEEIMLFIKMNIVRHVCFLDFESSEFVKSNLLLTQSTSKLKHYELLLLVPGEFAGGMYSLKASCSNFDIHRLASLGGFEYCSRVHVERALAHYGANWAEFTRRLEIPFTEPQAAPKVEPKAAPKVEPKTAPKVEPKAAPKAEPKVEPKVEPKAAPKVDSIKPPAKNEVVKVNILERENNLSQRNVDVDKILEGLLEPE